MIDPVRIQEAAIHKSDENYEFCDFLKQNADGGQLDSQFAQLHNELFASYDCSKCGNCCREYTVSVTKNEVGPIASHLKMAPKEFTKKYLEPFGKEYLLNEPCPFLASDGKCSIYICKPEVCTSFPSTGKPGGLASIYSCVSMIEVCPIVYEIFEQLKEIYGFTYLSD